MDHNEAVRLQAGVKYLIGELPKAQLEEYEEHYFDCPVCAEEIKATVAFMENTRQVLREKYAQVADNKAVAPVGGWFGWLHPAFAIPVLAVLLLVIGYQNGVSIPRLKDSASFQSAQIVGAPVHLAGSVRGGSDSGAAETKVPVRSGEGFVLDFDFTPARAFSSYRWQLLDQSGHPVRHGELGGEKTNQEVQWAVLGGVPRPGKYNLVFFGSDNGNGQTTKETEVQRLAFTVEFLP